MDSRGQSTQIGVVLLVALVVTTSAIATVFLLNSVSGESTPSLDLDGRVTDDADTLVMRNEGGASIPYADLSVVVVTDNETSRITPEAIIDNATFQPGTTWQQPLNVSVERGDVVTVFVVHEPTDQRLFEGEKRVALASGGESGNSPPSLSVSAPASSMTPGTATMTASGSDPEGELVTFAWEVVAGSAYASVSPPTGNDVELVTDAVDTTRTVTIEVTASDGAATTTRRIDVTLMEPLDEIPPTIDLSATGTETGDAAGVSVTVKSSEQLAELTVSMTGDDHSATLTSWSESIDGDAFIYEGSVTGLDDGEYTVSVTEAIDKAGNNGADSVGDVTVCVGDDECGGNGRGDDDGDDEGGEDNEDNEGDEDDGEDGDGEDGDGEDGDGEDA